MGKPDMSKTQQKGFIDTLKAINILRSTGILYILFSALTIAVAANYFTGAWLLYEYMPRSFVYLNAVRDYAMPIGAMPVFFNLLIVYSIFRLIIGVATVIFEKTPKRGGLRSFR